ncbi:zinc finger protein 91 [Biomphalaria glabrata]|nr:zinc finger protein 91 [Biomphalaria glabrata]
MEQTITMMTEEEIPEVGPNDIVIHLVNPYKCGLCELEFLEKSVFKEHMFSHLEQIKQEHPSSQIVMTVTLPPETPGGVTVTRDILQLGEDGSIKQVLQPTLNMTLNQVSPLRELEEAGVLKLNLPKPEEMVPMVPKAPLPIIRPSNNVSAMSLVEPHVQTVEVIQEGYPAIVSTSIKEEAQIVSTMSEITENNDNYLTFAFKGPNDEMQHIQIIKPEGTKAGDLMLELSNNSNVVKRNNRNGNSKHSSCDICGKVLSTSTNLLRHKMYHSAERPFVCDVCNKGFKDACNLKKHTIIHKRIFPCYLCKKSFLRKSLLALHLRRHETRTAMVKTGNSTKEVTIRTFVDDDGTRVEEMSMSALGGQTFEYKPRIVKADPSEIDKQVKKEINDQTNGQANGVSLSAGSEAQHSEIIENKEKKPAGQKTIFMVTSNGLQETIIEKQTVQEEGQGSSNTNAVDAIDVDDMPDLKIPEVPEEFVKMYQCGHCAKRTVQRGNMMRHLIHHLKEKPFVCDQCPKQFVDKGELVKHKKTHTKPYRCPQCNGAFAHNAQLLRHLESTCLGNTEELNYTVLEDGKTYRCDICRIEMKRLGNMIKHVGTHSMTSGRANWHHRQSNFKPKKFTPNKSFESASNKKMEISPYYYFDLNHKTYICCFCSRSFTMKSNILQHVKIHTKEKPYPCMECEQWFESTATLKRHLDIHTKPFKCDICPLAFSRKIFLDIHKRKHNEKEKDEETSDFGLLEDKKGYYCKHCNKKLNNKYRMLNHIKLHLSDRTHECPTCNKCFSCQYLLLKHKKVHAKPFACKVCGATFTRKFFLILHRKRAHPKKVLPVVKTPDLQSLDDSNASGEDKQIFPCAICGAPFSRLVIKMNHEKKCYEESKVMVRLSEGKGYKCKICGKVASLKHNLMVHIRKHTDVLKVENTGKIIVGEAYSDKFEPAKSTSLLADKVNAKVNKPSVSKFKPFSKVIKRAREESDSSDILEVEDIQDAAFEMDKEGRFQRIPGGYTCLDCRRKFNDYDALIVHLESHGDSTEKQENDKEEKQASINKAEKSETLEKKPVLKIIKCETPSSPAENKETENSTPKIKKEVSKKKAATPTSPALASKTKQSEEKVETPTPPRSTNRPARIQKMPSRFLE